MMFRSILFLALASTALSAAVTRDSTCTAGPITSNGRNCTIECGTDHAGGDYSSLYTPDFQTCVNTCSSDTNCATAQYSASNKYCYLKSGVSPSSPNANVNSVVCPDISSSCISDPITINGRQGTVQCGTDHPGGDYYSKYAGSLQTCENLCAADPACATAQYILNSQYCYLKNSITPAAQSGNVQSIVFTDAITCIPSSQSGRNYISNGNFESGTSYISLQTYQGTFQTNVTQGVEFEGCHAFVITPTSDPSGNRQYAATWSYSNLKPYNQYTVTATIGRLTGNYTSSNAPGVSISAEHRPVGGAYVCGFANTSPCTVTGTGGATGQTISTSFYILYSSSSLTLVFSWIGNNVGNEPILIDNIRLTGP